MGNRPGIRIRNRRGGEVKRGTRNLTEDRK